MTRLDTVKTLFMSSTLHVPRIALICSLFAATHTSAIDAKTERGLP